jgi:hypothetical protein
LFLSNLLTEKFYLQPEEVSNEKSAPSTTDVKAIVSKVCNMMFGFVLSLL